VGARAHSHGRETRGNLAAGGTARAQPLSARDQKIAEAIAPWHKPTASSSPASM